MRGPREIGAACWTLGGREKPRDYRVGRSYEPALAGGVTVFSSASRLPRSEACSQQSFVTRFNTTMAQTSLQTITHKAGNPNNITVLLTII